MSIYPCSVHGSRIRGPLSGLYPAVLSGGDRFSRRMRVCGPCIEATFATLGDAWIRVDVSDEGELALVCAACSSKHDDPSFFDSFFCTVYKKGEEREDWFAYYCPTCAKGLIDTLDLKRVSA